MHIGPIKIEIVGPMARAMRNARKALRAVRQPWHLLDSTLRLEEIAVLAVHAARAPVLEKQLDRMAAELGAVLREREAVTQERDGDRQASTEATSRAHNFMDSIERALYPGAVPRTGERLPAREARLIARAKQCARINGRITDEKIREAVIAIANLANPDFVGDPRHDSRTLDELSRAAHQGVRILRSKSAEYKRMYLEVRDQLAKEQQATDELRKSCASYFNEAHDNGLKGT